MITVENFHNQTESTLDTISMLPPSEVKYYLTILVNAIKNKNHASSHTLIQEIQHFIAHFQSLSHLSGQTHLDEVHPLSKLCASFHTLQNIAQTHTAWAKMKIILLHLVSTLAGFCLGLIGGLIGGVAGLARGLWWLEPIKGTAVGLLVGFTLGLVFGFRTPKKLFKDEVTRQLTFGLNGLSSCIENLQNIESAYIPSGVTIHPFSDYYAQVETEIKSLFSNAKEFQQFLNDQTIYHIKTFQASFIGQPMLHGYLGHHAYIQINIQKVEYLVEFALQPADTTEVPAQSETRVVTGKKLIEMLALHRKYQETNPSTLGFALGRLKFGDRDCLSYLNKILIGTSQDSVHVKRFTDMTLVGNLVGSIIEYVGPFQVGFFHRKQRSSVLSNTLEIDADFHLKMMTKS